jgi:hypothetical protein
LKGLLGRTIDDFAYFPIVSRLLENGTDEKVGQGVRKLTLWIKIAIGQEQGRHITPSSPPDL